MNQLELRNGTIPHLRISIRAYESGILDYSCKKIIEAVEGSKKACKTMPSEELDLNRQVTYSPAKVRAMRKVAQATRGALNLEYSDLEWTPRCRGPIPLPTKLRRYCVLTSPHVNKDARDHFEIRTHKRIIDVYQANASTIENLKRLDLSAGIDVGVKIKEKENCP
jgi:ribosomal protein S10